MKRRNSAARSQTTQKKKKISKNKNYKRGRRFEYRVKEYYEKLGYYVIRKYKSIGAEDLIAIRRINILRNANNEVIRTVSQVLHIQCKNLKKVEPLSKTAKERLLKLAAQTGGKALHVYNNSKHKLVFEELH